MTGKIKLPHASGNSMSIAAPATNPASDLELKLPATIGSANQFLKNSGTAGTLEFVNNLTFDGTHLNIGNTGSNWVGPLNVGTGTSGNAQVIDIYSNSDTYGGLWFSDGTSGADRYVGAIQYHHDSNYMNFHTGGAERLRIDSSGNVTKPGSSKFSTKLTYVNEFKSAGTVIACASPHVDDGNDFDATNDRFVAPVDGAYYFSFHINTDMNTGSDTEFHYVFRKNGSAVDGSKGGRAYGEWTPNGWEHIHMSMMMNLSANDYVDVITGRNNMRVDGGGYGQFTGFLVG